MYEPPPDERLVPNLADVPAEITALLLVAIVLDVLAVNVMLAVPVLM